LGAFGEKLRKQREQQGIGLDAISDTTKISTRMLRALEDEHFDQLPGGVFNKGFVRAYARQVGLNEEEAIADYLAAVRENQVRENEIQAHSASPDARDRNNRDFPSKDLPGNDRGQQLLTKERRKQFRRNEDRRSEDRRNENQRDQDSSSSRNSAAHPSAARFRQKYPAGNPESPVTDISQNNDHAAQIPWGKLAAILLLVTFALALWTSRRHREPAPAPQPTLASNQTPVAAPVPASASHPKQPPSAAAPLRSGKTSAAGPLSSTQLPAAQISTESGTGAAPAPANASPTNPAAKQSVASSATPTPVSSFSVLIRADETSWVSIMADGKPVAHETLIAPAHTSVRASAEVVVRTGNAAGISFELNGKEIPAQGNEGEVKTYVFDPAGFHVLPQQQSPAAVR
jgi:cytoskeletal protein RodZ